VFRNLDAEQRRFGKTNIQMGKMLGITRSTYETKKKTGTFGLLQIRFLCEYFECKFEYLFATDDDTRDSAIPLNLPVDRPPSN
jgi:DNA-binding XRE family transcriptional regulator